MLTLFHDYIRVTKKQTNNLHDMAKVQIKAKQITPLDGIFSIMGCLSLIGI